MSNFTDELKLASVTPIWMKTTNHFACSRIEIEYFWIYFYKFSL